MSDTYYTIDGRVTTTLRVEGSRFLAEAVPVGSRNEAEDHLDAVQQREHKATHHCMAYRLGADGGDFRYTDDGEPSGTAGRPILRQIDERDLTNTLVVVTRYFGGTKLGTGGLMRAYGDAAGKALDRATRVERVVRTSVRLRFAYDDTAPVRQLLDRFDAPVESSQYTAVTELTVGVRASEVKVFVEAFTNALSDRGEVLWIGDRGRETDGREGQDFS